MAKINPKMTIIFTSCPCDGLPGYNLTIASRGNVCEDCHQEQTRYIVANITVKGSASDPGQYPAQDQEQNQGQSPE